MATTLTDRYVHAATRFIPAASERSEIGRELRERIGDTVEGLREQGLDEEPAERQALSDLGDPLRIAAEYRDRPTHLIGPRYYFQLQRLLAILLAIVPPLVVALDLVAGISRGDSVGELIGSAVWSAILVSVHVIFWTTLVFWLVERYAPDSIDGNSWTVDMLPEVPDRDAGQRRSGLIGSVVWVLVLAGLLVWQQLASPFVDVDERVAVINPDLWNLWIPLLLGLLALELAHAFWVYRQGWTWTTAAANAVIGLAAAAILVHLMRTEQLLNPAFMEHVGITDQGLQTATPFVIGGIVLVTLWEVGDGLVRAARRR